MKPITAVVRPQRVTPVTEALAEAGYHTYYKWSVFGRGRRKGIKFSAKFFSKIPKRDMDYYILDNVQVVRGLRKDAKQHEPVEAEVAMDI